MTKPINNNSMMQVLDWAYNTAVGDIPTMGSAQSVAKSYLKEKGSLQQNVNSLIFWHTTTAATSGFLTGIGGLATLPVAIPANVMSVILVQLRMVTAIAVMGGFDVKDDQVKTLCYVCLCGNAAKDVLKGVGIVIGAKLSIVLIKKIPFEVIKQINKAVGFRLITKFGTTGAVNLGKMIPIVGGFIGGGIDAWGTNTIGSIAKQVFIVQ
jgi:hypothetical protein